MNNLISKASVCEILADIYPTDGEKVVAVKEVDKAYEAIQQLPSAQSERKKGRWLNINESEKWECSECGRMMWFSSRLGVKPSDYSFCPNCGSFNGGSDEE